MLVCQLGFILVHFLIHFLFSLCSYLELRFKISFSYGEFKTLISHTLSRKNRNVTQQVPCHIFCEDSTKPKMSYSAFRKTKLPKVLLPLFYENIFNWT